MKYEKLQTMCMDVLCYVMLSYGVLCWQCSELPSPAAMQRV